MTQEEAKGNPPERDKYVIINLLTFPGDIQTWFTYEHDFLLSHCYAYPWGLSAGTFLFLVMSNLLLWEKAAAILPCLTEEGGCTEPPVETFRNALNRAETIRSLAEEMNEEFLSKMVREDYTGYTARTHCHSTITNPPASGPEHTNIAAEKYLKMLINFVGAWNVPLYHLVVELSAMDDLPKTILANAKKIEENNKELLEDLRWILTKAYPTEKKEENFPRWQHLLALKSRLRNDQFWAIFNLSNCLRSDIYFTLFHLKTLKCQMTNNCFDT
ncbi:prolactin-8A9-like [Psammomys obesus]|uniref:prolactin-8A9-like n=1 Tax=Psammomys obesus TaxID=48139 RepID=UPI002452A96C|nr:prolactin-8A9-like [Psammomys obesus]